MTQRNCPVCRELPFEIACPEVFSAMPPMSAEAASALTRIMNEILLKRFQTGPMLGKFNPDEDDDE